MARFRADYFDVKRKIDLLKKTCADQLPDDKCFPLINSIMKNSVGVAVGLKNPAIYRSRKNDDHRLFENVSELIYPPEHLVKEKGRLNAVGQSILYAALCELGTINELAIKLEECFTITKFKRKESSKDPIVMPLGFKRGEYIPSEMTRAQQCVHDFLHSELTKIVSNDDEYNVTIAIGNHMLISPVKMYEETLPQLALAYPSVEAIKNRTTQTYNIAMLPKVFDDHYEMEEAFVYVLTLEDTHYQLNPLNRASCNSRGELIWQFNFEEMKVRLVRGLTYDRSCFSNGVATGA